MAAGMPLSIASGAIQAGSIVMMSIHANQQALYPSPSPSPSPSPASAGGVARAVQLGANNSGATYPTLLPNTKFGWDVEALGDLDLDGVPDLAVGANEDSDGAT